MHLWQCGWPSSHFRQHQRTSCQRSRGPLRAHLDFAFSTGQAPALGPFTLVSSTIWSFPLGILRPIRDMSRPRRAASWHRVRRVLWHDEATSITQSRYQLGSGPVGCGRKRVPELLHAVTPGSSLHQRMHPNVRAYARSASVCWAGTMLGRILVEGWFGAYGAGCMEAGSVRGSTAAELHLVCHYKLCVVAGERP